MKLPVKEPEGLLFTLKDVSYTPTTPTMKQPFTVKGKVELLKLPFVAPIWVVAKVTYPERWWEELIPIIGSPTVGEGDTALGGDFEISFPKGFEREGEFILEVEVYAGPTFTVDKITLPPFPPVAREKTTFIVAGEKPPEEAGFSDFRIVSYSKNGGPPVTYPNVLELELGDRCRVNVAGTHRNGQVSGEYHAAIWQKQVWDPHDEVVNAEKGFTLPASTDWEPFEGYIDIPITSQIKAGINYGLYVKIMGITGADIFTEYLQDVITISGITPEYNFDLVKPTASPGEVPPGEKVQLVCPVTSRCSGPVDAKAKVIIYEGSILTGHGTKITDYDVSFRIEPNATKNVTVSHTAIAGTIDRRDLEVEVYVGDTIAKQSEWDDVFYVKAPEDIVNFDLEKPTASPSEVAPYDTVTITCLVTSRCTRSQTVTAKFLIYEGSIYPGHGTLLWSQTAPFNISPGQAYAVSVKHSAIAGTIDRRDVEVEIYLDGILVKESEWDDIFRVIQPVELEILEVRIDPAGAGYVTTSPAPAGGTQWQFPHGTTVYVTAHPNSGYQFESWSGEMTDTTAITAPVYPMTEHRRITAHFKEIVVEEYTLTVGVNPYGGGTVTKSPNKTRYAKGEHVYLTASPASGYDFERWGGDVSGYSASVSVVMDRNRSVVANFKKKMPDPYTKVTFTVKGDGFPFLTSYWILYHYGVDGRIWQDYQQHRPGDIITIRDVTSRGRLSCFCASSVTGEWSEQLYSVDFAAEDGRSYRYDIASGIVYFR